MNNKIKLIYIFMLSQRRVSMGSILETQKFVKSLAGAVEGLVRGNIYRLMTFPHERQKFIKKRCNYEY